MPLAGAVRAGRQSFDDLGYRYEFDLFTPAEHLTLAINDQYAPAAAFLGTAKVDRNPAHVTYVVQPDDGLPATGDVADHAYWVSGVALRDGSGTAPLGTVDVRSQALRRRRPDAGPTTQHGAGTLTGGNLGRSPFTSQARRGARRRRRPSANRLDITATNVSASRSTRSGRGVSCKAQLNVTSDGPLTVKLAGCNQSRQFGEADQVESPRLEPGDAHRASRACAHALIAHRVGRWARGGVHAFV